MEVKIFQYRSYAVGEIAALYFPNISPGSATRNLSRYICLDEDLKNKLESLGYHKGIRILTPAMVGVIVEFMGRPSDFRTATA